ncbi:MAG: class I SAM-dependent methyltransferase [bacterium]|nr:class I SAM-dependent methyltransferase [bacterium]
MKQNTSWENEFVLGNYQKDLILPNLLRLLDIKKGETILDLGCGPGFFAKEFSKKGAKIIGADIAEELILIAKKNFPEGDFSVSPADNLKSVKDKSVDKITLILAIQNMENLQGVFAECNRVLKPNGKLFLVMNHPAFRVPKASSWGWDEENKIQYRRIGSYISESKTKIQMHPGENPDEFTLSFHRSLQVYFKALQKSGFSVTRLEEWNSNKKSEPGPRREAEDRIRKEIPLFLFLEARKDLK